MSGSGRTMTGTGLGGGGSVIVCVIDVDWLVVIVMVSVAVDSVAVVGGPPVHIAFGESSDHAEAPGTTREAAPNPTVASTTTSAISPALTFIPSPRVTHPSSRSRPGLRHH